MRIQVKAGATQACAWLVSVLAGLGAPVHGQPAQLAEDPPVCVVTVAGKESEFTIDKSPIFIPLNDTGIADWDFLNPRRPYPLVRKARGQAREPELDEGCFKKILQDGLVDVRFENQASSRAFEVKFPYKRNSADKLRQTFSMQFEASIEKLNRARQLAELREEIEKLGKEVARLDNKPMEPASASIEVYEQRLDLIEANLKAKREEPESEEAKAKQKLADLDAIERQTRLDWSLEATARAKSTPARQKEEKKAFDERLGRIQREREKVQAALRTAGDSLRELESEQGRLAQAVDQAQRDVAKLGAMMSLMKLQFPEARQGEISQAEAKAATEYLKVVVGGQERETLCRNAATAFTFAERATVEALRNCVQELAHPIVSSLFADFLSAASKEINVYDELMAQPLSAGKEFTDLCTEDKAAMVYSCSYIFTLGPGQSLPFKRSLWLNLDGGLIVFTVRFAADAEIPANATGYLATVPKPAEPPNASKWELSAALGYTEAPNRNHVVSLPKLTNPVGKDDLEPRNVDRFSPQFPYEGDRARTLPGNANLKLTQGLGNRAAGSVTLSFTDTTLDSSQDEQTKVSEYMVNLYGDNGLQLRLGKYQLFTTRDAIAGSEAGEGFELQWKALAIGTIIKKEPKLEVPQKKTAKVESSRVYLFKLKNLPFRSNTVLRTWTLNGVYGDENGRTIDTCDGNGDHVFDNANNSESPNGTETCTVPYEYGTLGTELSFGIGNANHDDSKGNYSGNFAYYYSRRELGAVSRADFLRDGAGSVALLTGAWNERPNQAGEVPHSVQLQVGRGRGDDPKTPKDEGYLGEAPTFAPDKIFLSRFAGKIGDPRPNLRADVAPGLSNKTYFGARFTSNLSSLPLEAVAALLDIREKVASRSWSAAFNWYHFNEPVYDSREAGFEFDIDFSIQVPKGVTSSLGLGYFFVGDALQDVIRKEPLIVTTQIKVTL